MKSTVVIVLAVIGGLTLLSVGVWSVGKMLVPGYADGMRREFGSPEAIADISALYSRIEVSPHDAALSGGGTGPQKVRNIPKSWIPARFSSRWGTDTMEDFGGVLAYYDEKDALIGIEFFKSRAGCFVSRDPMRCPAWFGTLRRLAEKPLYVTSRVTAGEE